MKFRRCVIQNFGSYRELDFDFSDLGLALVHGPTGSGKSTLQDAPAWILFGVTAKDGNVDDVRSWVSPDAHTYGELEVELPDGVIVVSRTRGTGKENDLFWTEEEFAGDKNRGKDISETQKLLEKRLGCSADLYLTGAYFHEFSPTAAFFVTNAKARRAIFEKIANLDLPVKLANRAADARKKVKAEIKDVELAAIKLEGKVDQLLDSKDRAHTSAQSWKESQVSRLVELKARHKGFEVEKASKLSAIQLKIDRFEQDRAAKQAVLFESLNTLEQRIEKAKGQRGLPCPTCGVHPAGPDYKELQIRQKEYLKQLERVQNEENPFYVMAKEVKKSENHYDAQIAEESARGNPFENQISQLAEQIVETNKAYEAKKAQLQALEIRHGALNQLYDISYDLRGALLQRAVSEIEAQTNSYLETYFEGEFRVSFSLSGSDNLDVEISKGGYPCVYRQLSKGQRGMLKLAFVVSIMRASANNAGVHFDNLFFDEALDGLDADLKVKAFTLFESLAQEHGSIMVIDHATELKQLFDKQYQVVLVNDVSSVTVNE